MLKKKEKRKYTCNLNDKMKGRENIKIYEYDTGFLALYYYIHNPAEST